MAKPVSKGLIQSLLLAAAAALIALALAFVHPRPLPRPAGSGDSGLHLSVADARAVSNALWVDARAAAAYEQGHVPGALRLTLADWDELFPNLVTAWTPGQPVVVYCEAGSCLASEEVAQRLLAEKAFTEVRILKGDWRDVTSKR